MAQTLAPIDERLAERGIFVPLPITPIVPDNFPKREDGHHAIFPSEAPELAHIDYRLDPMALNPRALRWARVQTGNRRVHNEYFHYHYQDGVPLPSDEHQIFKTMLLLTAGYVPDHVVDPVGRRPMIIDTSDEMRRRLHAQRRLHVQAGRVWGVGLYFGNYIMKYGVGAIKDTAEATQFMETQDQFKRWSLGFSVLRLAADAVIDDVEPVYQQARDHGQIDPNKRPPRALRFLMKHFNNHQPDYQSTLELSLASALSAA